MNYSPLRTDKKTVEELNKYLKLIKVSRSDDAPGIELRVEKIRDGQLLGYLFPWGPNARVTDWVYQTVFNKTVSMDMLREITVVHEMLMQEFTDKDYK